jgi:hypothetical protein
MNNIYFRKWLDFYEAAAPYLGGVDYTWINPDIIWKVKNSMTFFYTENKLFVASDYGLRSDITHTDFTLECPELN